MKQRQRETKGSHKTTCSKCGNKLEPERFGKYRYCRKCHAQYARLNRPRYPEMTPEAVMKSECRRFLNHAVKAGKVEKKSCEVCGSVAVEAHHEDYLKPLKVKWLCRKHHVELHKTSKNAKSDQ